MRDKGEAARRAIETMARAGSAAVREFTGNGPVAAVPEASPATGPRCRCTADDAADCDGGGVAPHSDGGCGCACHGGMEATDAVTTIAAMASDESLSPKTREVFAMSHESLIADVLSLRSTCEEYARMHEENLATTYNALKQAKEAEAALETARADLASVTAERDRSRVEGIIVGLTQAHAIAREVEAEKRDYREPSGGADDVAEKIYWAINDAERMKVSRD